MNARQFTGVLNIRTGTPVQPAVSTTGKTADEAADPAMRNQSRTRRRRLRRDACTIAVATGIAIATGEGTVGALLGTWVLARQQVEDDYADRGQTATGHRPIATERLT